MWQYFLQSCNLNPVNIVKCLNYSFQQKILEICAMCNPTMVWCVKSHFVWRKIDNKRKNKNLAIVISHKVKAKESQYTWHWSIKPKNNNSLLTIANDGIEKNTLFSAFALVKRKSGKQSYNNKIFPATQRVCRWQIKCMLFLPSRCTMGPHKVNC